jgi:DNA-binding PadR family transcriptional regulator
MLKETKTKITKNFLTLIILRRLQGEPAHGYRIIVDIKKFYGVYFGPSTVYPRLNRLEENGYVQSEWRTENDRPRKIYHITQKGEKLLDQTASSLLFIINQLTA